MIQENKPEPKEIAIKKLDMKLLEKVNQIKTIINKYIENNDSNENDEKFIKILACISIAASGVNNFIYIREDMSYISLLARKLTILYNTTIDAKRHCITDAHKEIYKQIEIILDLSSYNKKENITTQAKDKLDEMFNKIVEKIIEIIEKNSKYREPWTVSFLGEEYTEEDECYYDIHSVYISAMNVKYHLQENGAFNWYNRWDFLGKVIKGLSKRCSEVKNKNIIEISSQISSLYIPDYLLLIDNVINGNCPLLLAIADTNI